MWGRRKSWSWILGVKATFPPPLFISGAAVEMVHISRDLKWTINTSNILEKAHQRLYFLRRLRQAGLNTSVLYSVLQVCGGEYTHLLHHHLVWELLCC